MNLPDPGHRRGETKEQGIKRRYREGSKKDKALWAQIQKQEAEKREAARRLIEDAPAGEDKHTCSCREIGRCVTDGVVHRKDGPCFMDRRKGERRKGEEFRDRLHVTVNNEPRRLYRLSEFAAWQSDRRSHDRRKK
jgi:hypothetical protein